MMTIYFKNGETREITQEIAHLLRNKILSHEGDNKWHAINDEDGDLIFLINLSEVVYMAHNIQNDRVND